MTVSRESNLSSVRITRCIILYLKGSEACLIQTSGIKHILWFRKCPVHASVGSWVKSRYWVDFIGSVACTMNAEEGLAWGAESCLVTPLWLFDSVEVITGLLFKDIKNVVLWAYMPSVKLRLCSCSYTRNYHGRQKMCGRIIIFYVWKKEW